MTKITPEHLARGAVVYVRQSTAVQVVHNLESQRRQYGLADRARQLGWADVEVIDDDLGRSGAGARRPGFTSRGRNPGCEALPGAAFCERQGYFTRSPTPLSKRQLARAQMWHDQCLAVLKNISRSCSATAASTLTVSPEADLFAVLIRSHRL